MIQRFNSSIESANRMKLPNKHDFNVYRNFEVKIKGLNGKVEHQHTEKTEKESEQS